jgi:hypothetical protein
MHQCGGNLRGGTILAEVEGEKDKESLCVLVCVGGGGTTSDSVSILCKNIFLKIIKDLRV